jgi:uncharacterized protein (TIGR02145 family)
VTLSFTSPSIISGACVYASGYPPEAEYINVETIKFTGTPLYDLVLQLADASTVTRQSGNLFDVPPSYTLLSFTDKTGAPGVIKCIPPATFTLLASASGFCEDDMEGITFALDSTEKDKQYQLFRNNGGAGDGSVLTGNGSALTFTGTFNVAGTYTARTVAEGLTCAIAMNGTHVVTKNPLPANPDVTGDSRNCPGTVTLRASSSGAVIDWYDDDITTSTLHTGESYTTPEIYTSTTYYVQARVESTGCLSARVAVAAEVDMDGCFTVPGATVDFSAFDPDPNAIKGSTWTLRDTRAGGNSYTYIVKKMADNRIWMVQDLKFGSCGTGTSTWRQDDTQSKTSMQPTVYADAANTYVGHCRQNTQTQIGAGYLYNWPGAMNNSYAYNGSTVTAFACSGTAPGTVSPNPGACQGICPDGWHLPTESEVADAYAKFSASIANGGYGCADAGCWNPTSEWQGANSAMTQDNGSIQYSGNLNRWYTSSATGTLMYRYGYTESTYVFGTQSYKWNGYSVRCAMNY